MRVKKKRERKEKRSPGSDAVLSDPRAPARTGGEEDSVKRGEGAEFLQRVTGCVGVRGAHVYLFHFHSCAWASVGANSSSYPRQRRACLAI